MWQFLVPLLASSGSVSALLIIIFLCPGKVEHWMAIFWRVIHGLSFGSRKIKNMVERKTVALDIQDSVNGFCEQIERETPGIVPHPLKIEWVRDETRDSFIKNGCAVVRLKNYANQDKNLVDATLCYLRADLLPRSKRCLDDTLRTASEFKVAGEIFLQDKDTGAYDHFLEYNLKKEAKTNPSLENDMQMLVDMDDVGFFTRIFLSEVKAAGEKLLGTVPTPSIQQELREFASFLRKIATKEHDQKVPLDFFGTKVKVAAVLVAETRIIRGYGLDPYVRRVRRSVEKGYETIYLSGWGKEFSKRVFDIGEAVQRDMVKIVRRYRSYPVRSRTQGTLLVCQSRQKYVTEQRRLQGEVEQALKDSIPEVESGSIAIESIARIRGRGCKVAVSNTSTPHRNSSPAYLEVKREQEAEVKDRLSERFVKLIPWSPDPSEFIVNALWPMKAREVHSVKIDEALHTATVRAVSGEAVGKGVGLGGINVLLAGDLTGYAIILESPQGEKLTQTPEEEIQEVIEKCVPEVRSGEIEIVRTARIKGVGSKVLVRWTNAPQGGGIAFDVCRQHFREIQKDTFGEWIYFCEWSDDLKTLIGGCLSPLRKSDIQQMDLDHGTKIATIKLTDTLTSSPVWRSQCVQSLAEKITDWTINIED